MIRYTKKQKAKMIESGKKGGFTKTRYTAVSKHLKQLCEVDTRIKHKKILDFGAGANASQVKLLRDEGFNNIVGYDFPENMPEWSSLFDRDALKKKWKVILVSNVINIQPRFNATYKLIEELILNNLDDDGILIFNVPKTPRYCKIDVDLLINFLHNHLDLDIQPYGELVTVKKL